MVERLSGTATDLIVIFGTASINLAVVDDYIVLILILFVIGISVAFLAFLILIVLFARRGWIDTRRNLEGTDF